MYLEKFIIKNFRAIEDLELDFDKGLNIIIGENNSGKTAVIDALRLCLGDFQQPRDIYCSKSDFRIDKSELGNEIEDIEFHLFFKFEDFEETGLFNELDALNEEGERNLQLHFRFELIDHKLGKQVKRKVWGGATEGSSVSHEVRSVLRNVYLSALRDPNRNLRPNRENILGDLYSSVLIGKDEEKDKLLTKVTNVLTKDEWKNFIIEGNRWLLDHLDYLSYSTDEKKQKIKVGFATFEFDKFIRNLIIQLPIFNDNLIANPSDQQYFEIWQNGLGLNNLIYTAAVLGNIKQMKEISEAEYNLLLIEEPEAHLHPQLQNTFFNYLKRLDEENEFQIIVTSHSPTIAAKTNLNLVTILQNDHHNICSTQIKNLNLENNTLKYLQKFLDVTRSQMFFANGVILVEGISEALLIPIFSKIMEKDYDIERRGIEVVNVNGVAFEHFAKLFNDPDGKGLKCKCALITDDDAGKKGAKERVKAIEKLESDNLKPTFAENTFEYELFKNNWNNEVILEAFKELHSKLHGKLIKINDPEKRAMFFAEKIASNKSKSKFAYSLALKLEEDSKDFKVPDYIEEAIKFVIGETS
ncbi:AAA family ATPase [Methanobacterium sp.]|uniref:ATP-dependent nuclease n=1 Tax=Methanobacterium sp. TaxID=2164 RepID=UPI0031584903